MAAGPPAAADDAGDDGAGRTPLDVAASRVGDRWSLLLVDALMSGTRRFGELQAAVEGIAPNILSRRLKHLEAERVVIARPYSRKPLRYEYQLSAAGRELASALRLLSHWGGHHDVEVEPVRHRVCGTPAEVRWWCPTCARLLDDDESDDVHYL